MASTTARPYNLPADAVWFITGCSSGLGLSLACLIASHPTHRLVATARNPSTLSSLLNTPSGTSNPRVLTLPLDVTIKTSVSAAIASTLTHFGRIDVMVNNAGYGLSGDTESTLDHLEADVHPASSQARAIFETNYWGTVRMTLHAMRIMREENPKNGDGQQGGVIMNVTSLGGFKGFPGNAYYHSTKFAVEGFTESVSREVRPEWNIHFSIIEPGGINTNYAGSSMVRTPVHPAYTAPDCPARVLDAYIDNPEAIKNWASAADVAAVMYEIVSRDKPVPMRIPVGLDAWGIIRAEVNDIDQELEEIKELSIRPSNGKQRKSLEFLAKNF